VVRQDRATRDTVFNAEQCDDLPAHFTAKADSPALPLVQRLQATGGFFAGTGAEIRHGGTRAYYAEALDYVQMPPFETFRDAESYAATLAHELTHWTKHESAWHVTWAACAMMMKAMPARNSLPN